MTGLVTFAHHSYLNYKNKDTMMRLD